MKIVVITFA